MIEVADHPVYVIGCNKAEDHHNQTVNDFSIDKPTNRRFCSTSLFLSSQIPVGADTPWGHIPHPRYSCNSCHRLNIANSLKTMNQELLQFDNWVSPTIPDSQKNFAELPTEDISMIEAGTFNTLV